MRMRPSGGATAPDTRHPQDRPEPARGRRRPLAGLGAVAVVASLAFAVPSPASAQTPADPAADATTTTASVAASEDAAGYWTADRRADALATEGAADTEAAAVPAAPSSTPSRLVEHPGLTYVGVLFYVADGRNRTCTASVVDTPEGDAIATAAHCLVDAATRRPHSARHLRPRDPGRAGSLRPLAARRPLGDRILDAHARDGRRCRLRPRPLPRRPEARGRGQRRASRVRPPAPPGAGRRRRPVRPRLPGGGAVLRTAARGMRRRPAALPAGPGLPALLPRRGSRRRAGLHPRRARAGGRRAPTELRSVVASPANPAGGRAAVVLATWGDEAKQALAALPVG